MSAYTMTASPPEPSVFHELGVRPVINACGIYTDLGGSLLSPRIMAAWAELNQSWIEMTELLDVTGASIADWLGVPAARITPGASAAISLGVGACVVGKDPAKWDQLPDTSGLRHEILFQARQLEQYKYTVCTRLPGAVVASAGTSLGTTAAQLEAAINIDTAAIFIPAHLEDQSTVPLQTVARIARAHDIPVIVDAAYMNFPLVPDSTAASCAGVAKDVMSSFFHRGADLVCFSAKYFWGPNAGGFICGREDLIQRVSGLDFTRFESGRYKPFGRTFKMGRFEIAATALALRAWLTMDHTQRLATYARQVGRLAELLDGIPGVSTRSSYFTLDERWVSGPVNCLVVQLDPRAPVDVHEAQRRLYERTPRILPIAHDGSLTFVMESVREGDEIVIGHALRDALRAG